jgi:hypothetical protein
MPKLLEKYHVCSGVNWRESLYYQIKIEKGDTLYDICSLMKMDMKEIETAYHKPVNATGNGVNIDSKGPHDIKPDKIFYVKLKDCLDKRLNVRQLFYPTTSIRCMYGKDDPMKYKYILFWETNGKSGDSKDFNFKTNDAFNKYRRKDALQPVGLGVTDGDGILHSQSLKWIEDVKTNKSIKLIKRKIPDVFYKSKDINIEKTFYTAVGRSGAAKKRVHTEKVWTNFHCKLNLYDKGTYNIKDDNWIFKENVSRFHNNVKYAFMPLPIDIFIEKKDETSLINIDKKFETLPLFDIDKNFIKEFIPHKIKTEDRLRKRSFYTLDKGEVDKRFNSIKKEGDYTSLKKPVCEVYKTQKGFEDLVDNTPPKNYQKLRTEKVPMRKEVVIPCTLPEWIARLNIRIKKSKKLYKEYEKRAKHYSDSIAFADKIANFSSIVAKYPYRDPSIEYSKRDLAIPLSINQHADLFKEKIVEKLKNKPDEEFAKARDSFQKEVDKLYEVVHNKEFVQEIVDYCEYKIEGIPFKNKPIFLKLNDDEKEKHLSHIQNELSLTLLEAYHLFKKVDIFNFKVDSHDESTPSKAFKNYFDIVLKNKIPDDKTKQPLFVIKESLLKSATELKDFTSTYIANTPGPPSLLVGLADFYSSYIYGKAADKKSRKQILKGLEWLENLFKKNNFIKEKINDVNKIVDNYKQKGIKAGKYLNEVDFEDLKIDRRKTMIRYTNNGMKGFFFVMNAYNLLNHVDLLLKKGKTWNQVFEQFLHIANGLVGLRMGYIGLFSKYADDIKISKIKVLGHIGFWITTVLSLIQHAKARKMGDDKGRYLIYSDIALGMVGLLFFGTVGAVAGIAFLILSLFLSPLIEEWIYGGPIEKQIYNWCIQFSDKSNYFNAYNQFIIKDSNLNEIFKKIIEINDDLDDNNKKLSWKAVIPLLTSGYCVFENGKINYDDTEDLIENIVQVERHWWIIDRQEYAKRYSTLTDFEISDLINTYKKNLKIIEDSDFDSKEFKKSYEIVKNLRIGTYKDNLPYRTKYVFSKGDYHNLINNAEIDVFDFIPYDVMSKKKLKYGNRRRTYKEKVGLKKLG